MVVLAAASCHGVPALCAAQEAGNVAPRDVVEHFRQQDLFDPEKVARAAEFLFMKDLNVAGLFKELPNFEVKKVGAPADTGPSNRLGIPGTSRAVVLAETRADGEPPLLWQVTIFEARSEVGMMAIVLKVVDAASTVRMEQQAADERRRVGEVSFGLKWPPEAKTEYRQVVFGRGNMCIWIMRPDGSHFDASRLAEWMDVKLRQHPSMGSERVTAKPLKLVLPETRTRPLRCGEWYPLSIKLPEGDREMRGETRIYVEDGEIAVGDDGMRISVRTAGQRKATCYILGEDGKCLAAGSLDMAITERDAMLSEAEYARALAGELGGLTLEQRVAATERTLCQISGKMYDELRAKDVLGIQQRIEILGVLKAEAGIARLIELIDFPYIGEDGRPAAIRARSYDLPSVVALKNIGPRCLEACKRSLAAKDTPAQRLIYLAWVIASLDDRDAAIRWAKTIADTERRKTVVSIMEKWSASWPASCKEGANGKREEPENTNNSCTPRTGPDSGSRIE
jgi:hypothetical protein